MFLFEKSFLYVDFLYVLKIKDRMVLILLDFVIIFGEVIFFLEEIKICFFILCINVNKEDVEFFDVVVKVW